MHRRRLGINLSDGDKRGLNLLYPHTADELAELQARADSALDAVGAGNEGLPTAGDGLSDAYRSRLVELVQAQAGGAR